jgi:hypothetical protein
VDTVKQAIAAIIGSMALSSCLSDPNIVGMPEVQESLDDEPTDESVTVRTIDRSAPGWNAPWYPQVPAVPDRSTRLAWLWPDDPAASVQRRDASSGCAGRPRELGRWPRLLGLGGTAGHCPEI